LSDQNRTLRALVVACVLTVSGTASAEELRIAAASNTAGVLEELAGRFEAQTGHEAVLAFGATGKHYAQIRNGAPFDVFLAADAERPRRLEEERIAVAGSRFTYARGVLVLWSPRAGTVDDRGDVLGDASYRYLALANPRLAPYGRAARQVLQARGLWEATEGRRVMGENVAQTFQFVKTGNADLGFVAASQLYASSAGSEGSSWRIPPSLYDAIEQQAVLIEDSPSARSFLQFVRGEEARAVFRQFGYEVP